MIKDLSFMIERFWYQSPRWYHVLLSPVSWFYRAVIFSRRLLYRVGIFSRYKASVPVIVVGNITVGGTGKTPFVMGLIKALKEKGYSPGIVSRGYGAYDKKEATLLDSNSTPEEVGDEPFMLYQRLGVPVAVCHNRVLAIKACEEAGCDVVVSDDGLAHYAFKRDCEIVCIDGVRQFGSGYTLPVGPLREPKSRLRHVDFCVTTVAKKTGKRYESLIVPECLISVTNSSKTLPLNSFCGENVRALAGIGHPERFFALLEDLGYTVHSEAFRDHHRYTKADLSFYSGERIVMTEKDAVKCRLYDLDNAWYIKVKANFEYERIIDSVFQR